MEAVAGLGHNIETANDRNTGNPHLSNFYIILYGSVEQEMEKKDMIQYNHAEDMFHYICTEVRLHIYRVLKEQLPAVN